MNAEKPYTVSRWSFLQAYPFSVSQINQVLSLFVVAIWAVLVFLTFPFDFNPGSILIVLVTVAALWALMYRTETRRTGGGAEFRIRMRLRKRGE